MGIVGVGRRRHGFRKRLTLRAAAHHANRADEHEAFQATIDSLLEQGQRAFHVNPAKLFAWISRLFIQHMSASSQMNDHAHACECLRPVGMPVNITYRDQRTSAIGL
ncbi:hypothetical protein D9M71_510530 [compost metagenome]